MSVVFHVPYIDQFGFTDFFCRGGDAKPGPMETVGRTYEWESILCYGVPISLGRKTEDLHHAHFANHW